MPQSVEFHQIVFRNIGKMYMEDHPEPFARVDIQLYFPHTGTDINTAIDISAKISYGPDSTISEIHTAALDQVKVIIAAANDLLSGCDLQQLQALSAERQGAPDSGEEHLETQPPK